MITQLGLQEMYSKQQKQKDETEGVDDLDVNNIVPTIGFNVKEVVYGKLQFVLWDLGGQANVGLFVRDDSFNNTGIRLDKCGSTTIKEHTVLYM